MCPILQCTYLWAPVVLSLVGTCLLVLVRPLLLARLAAEAAPDTSVVYGAGWGGGRLGAFFAPRLIVEAMRRGLGANGADGGGLTREDAYSVACWASWDGPLYVRGSTALYAAAGHTAMEWIGTVSMHFFSSC